MAGRSQGREPEKKKSRHASYVMIIIKHRGRLFYTLPRLGGTGLGPRAGVHGGEGVGERRRKKKNRKRRRRGSRETAGEVETEAMRGWREKNDKLEEDRGEY